MNQYIVSARKYRPSTFASVVGQGSLTTTLKNAIAGDKLAHAYLFCGPRGVGKTTCARIFAKTINCFHVTPEGEACNECESCVSFNEQRSYNIYELDAASNNKVDDIRLLVEQVRIPPQIGKYKVYIIDEVHMLSTQAFNAFLKTLEEPPQHAIFILATTEKHKIIPTILSRCQIYDFNRIRVDDIVNHLEGVAKREGYSAEPEALNIIALKADGGMRDALSIFDQVVSFTRGNITYEEVIRNLNVLDYEYYFRLTEFFLQNKVSDALLLFNDILSKGFEGSHFISGLASHFRDLLVSKDEVTLPLLEVGAAIRERYKEQAKMSPVDFLYKGLALCNQCDIQYRESKNKRLLVELTLIQLAQLIETKEGSKKKQAQQIKPIVKEERVQYNSNTSPSQPLGAKQQTKERAIQQQSSSEVREPQQVHYKTGDTSSQAKATENNQGETKKPSLKDLQGSNSNKKIPSFNKNEISFSIRGGNQTETEEQQSKEVVSSSKEVVLGDADFTDEELKDSWVDYAMSLPIEHKASAMRMKSATLNRIDEVTFEMVVDNAIIERDFITLKPFIESYLRKQLDNGGVTMEVRVIEPEENKRPFSRMEKFQMMADKNKALYKLRDEFDLELY
ncbi:MAG: DNA polymerase III subunit gamma/tau [Bacteroides sp.]|nr:DNA polymerase III subunit gamma/tau [Bacteroides sp.]